MRTARETTFAVMAAFLACVSPRALASAAEYGFHWIPVDGGPTTAETVRDLLQIDDKKVKKFEVLVFAVTRPTAMPQAISVIARERRTDGEVETSYKLRADVPMPVLAPESVLTCPLAGAMWSEEVDLVWGLP